MAENTKIFLDTEFTSLEEPCLISLGLIADNNQQIYLESNDWQLKRCSNFCNQKVIPLLNKNELASSPKVIETKLTQWLSQFDNVTIMVDNNIDIRLFVNLFENLPSNINQAYDISDYIKYIAKALWFNSYPNYYEEAATKLINRFFFLTTQYYTINQCDSHHALSDAKANMYAFKEIEKCFTYHISQILQRNISY